MGRVVGCVIFLIASSNPFFNFSQFFLFMYSIKKIEIEFNQWFYSITKTDKQSNTSKPNVDDS